EEKGNPSGALDVSSPSDSIAGNSQRGSNRPERGSEFIFGTPHGWSDPGVEFDAPRMEGRWPSLATWRRERPDNDLVSPGIRTPGPGSRIDPSLHRGTSKRGGPEIARGSSREPTRWNETVFRSGTGFGPGILCCHRPIQRGHPGVPGSPNHRGGQTT